MTTYLQYKFFREIKFQFQTSEKIKNESTFHDYDEAATNFS